MKKLLSLAFFFFVGSVFAAPITISFKDQPLPYFLKTIYSDVLAQSFVISPALSGSSQRVTLELVFDGKDDLKNRLPEILASLNVKQSTSGGAALILPLSAPDLGAQGIPSLPPVFQPSAVPFSAPSLPAPVKKSLRVYQPKHITAKDLCSFFSGDEKNGFSICRPAGSVVTFSVGDDEFKDLKSSLDLLDVPSSRVEITTSLAEVTLGESHTSGISVITKILGASVNYASSAAVSGLTFASRNFSLVLDALGTDSRVVNMTSPSGVVQSGKKLDLAIGDRQPTLSSVSTSGTGLATQSIQYQQAGVILSVTPTVMAGGRVDLVIESEVSSFSQTTTGIANSPTISQRKISTSLQLASGDAVVLGGLRSSKDQKIKNSFFGVTTGGASSGGSTDLVLLVHAKIVEEKRGIGGEAPDGDSGG